MTDNANLSTQKIHQLGIDAAVSSAKSHGDDLIISSSGKYYVNTVYGLREVVFCCSTSSKNGDRINCNISRREYQNRFTHEGLFDDKVYILVHMNLETGVNRFFKIPHHDLCMLQYADGCMRRNSYLTMEFWLGGGVGRNNISCDALSTAGYEVWK